MGYSIDYWGIKLKFQCNGYFNQTKGRRIKKMFENLNFFLQESLDGFIQLEDIEQGNVALLINKPSQYILNHISADYEAREDKDVIIVTGNNNYHFIFVPKSKEKRLLTKGMVYKNGKWQ